MKKFLQLVLVSAGIGIIVASSTSCSSTYDATPDVPGKDTMKNPLRGDFTAMVDGVNFVANSKATSDQTSNGIRTITISGTMDSPNKNPNNNQTITLAISDYKGPNTYPIKSGTVGSYTILASGTATNYLAKAGDTLNAITITNDNGNFQGTFNFVVAPGGLGNADNHTVYGGSFNIPK